MPRKTTRRTFLATAGSAAIGTALFSSTASAATSDEEIVAAAPTDAVDRATYPTTGTDEDNPVMTVYGNPKCPYTQDFVLNNLPDVIEEYVDPGDLNVRVRMLVYEPDPDDPSHGSAHYYISDSDPTIARATYGVWNWEDENYWGYLYDQFQDLPSGTVTAYDMADRMEAAGVRNWGKIRNEAYEGKYQDQLDRTPEAAYDLGVPYTPTAEMGGDLTNPRFDSVFDWIDRHL
jgi:protein-disulfide isomerase